MDTEILAEIAALKAANPGLDLSGLEAKVATLTDQRQQHHRDRDSAGFPDTMTNVQAWIIVVEVGIIALAALVGLLRH